MSEEKEIEGKSEREKEREGERIYFILSLQITFKPVDPLKHELCRVMYHFKKTQIKTTITT